MAFLPSGLFINDIDYSESRVVTSHSVPLSNLLFQIFIDSYDLNFSIQPIHLFPGIRYTFGYKTRCHKVYYLQIYYLCL